MEGNLRRLKTKEEKWAYLMGYSAGFNAMKEETEKIIADSRDMAMRRLIRTDMTLRLPAEEE